MKFSYLEEAPESIFNPNTKKASQSNSFHVSLGAVYTNLPDMTVFRNDKILSSKNHIFDV